MNCKFCDELLEEGVTVCPSCGKEQDELEETEVVEEVEEAEDFEIEVEDIDEEDDAPKKTKLWQKIVAVICVIALIAVLVFAVLRGMGLNVRLPKNDVFRKDSYTIARDNIADEADVVVAKAGDLELTNGELQIFYWNVVDSYLQNYGTYFFNPLQPLEEQVYDEATGQSWQQFFVEEALKTWHRYAAINVLGKEAGYEPSEDMKASMELLSSDLEARAAQYGLDDVDALIAQWYGDLCKYRHIESYMRTSYYAMEYLNVLSESLNPTDQEIETYYYVNESQLNEKGVTKDAGLSADVRHILIAPEGGTLSEDGTSMVYSEEAWAAAKLEADALLAHWKAGDATEESFIALVAEHTDDFGSASTGGLYEDITLTSSYVEEFRNWATSAYRNPGDVEIVKTRHGYHIMYYVQGEEVWKEYCRQDLISQRFNAMVEEAMEENELKTTYRKIVILDIYAPLVTDPTEATDATVETAPATDGTSADPTDETTGETTGDSTDVTEETTEETTEATEETTEETTEANNTVDSTSGAT